MDHTYTTEKLLPCTAKHAPRQPTVIIRTMETPDGPLTAYLVAVPLPDGGPPAILSLGDYNAMMRGGYTNQFYPSANGNGKSYVCTSHEDNPGMPVRVHHLVYGRQGRKHVGFVDHNPRNLLLSNLGRVHRRYGKATKAAETAEAHAAEGW